MLQYFWKYRLICVGICVIFLCLFLFSSGLISRAEAWVEANDIQIYGQQEGNRWSLYSTRDLYELCEGGAVAWMIQIRIPACWQVTAIEGNRGLVATASAWEGNIRVLLDGIVSPPGEDATEAFLTVTIEAEGNTVDNESCVGDENIERSIQLLPDENAYIYVLKEDRHILRYPYTVMNLNEETTHPDERGTDEPKLCETTDFDADIPEIETSDWQESEIYTQETVREPVLGAPLEFSYMGCQETGISNGTYAVRFLFCGAYTPVICIEGGGFLTVQVHHEDFIEAYERDKPQSYLPPGQEEWTICVFRGLWENRLYRFMVYTEEQALMVTYEGGRYMGYIPILLADSKNIQ